MVSDRGGQATGSNVVALGCWGSQATLAIQFDHLPPDFYPRGSIPKSPSPIRKRPAYDPNKPHAGFEADSKWSSSFRHAKIKGST
ncbi:hypothetical protein FRB94_007319 [Tulasnella sp. JGI-2019a]|nr:hypothetical protein FRB94_007319 [Tulasnella sp. JGI-2019a]KAG9013277.1 hypothetical protein FRB93_000800 [Tulasnella sp. JGI-2019a]